MGPDDRFDLLLELECSWPCTDACATRCVIGACVGVVGADELDAGSSSAL
jgi:hypothetical protein